MLVALEVHRSHPRNNRLGPLHNNLVVRHIERSHESGHVARHTLNLGVVVVFRIEESNNHHRPEMNVVNFIRFILE